FDACGVRVQTPDAPADSQVRWYFGEDSLFLVVRRLGFLGPLARELDEVRRRPQRYLATSPVWSAAVPSALAGIAATTDTVSADSGIPSEFVNIDVEAVREELQSAAANRHSDFSDPTGESGYEEEWNVADVQLSSTEIARQSRRLSEVCRRLAACRRPVVPVNGVCVLLPDGMFSSLRGAGVRLGQALRHDLRLLQDELQIVAPVSIVLTGAEQDDGVVELIRRGGPEGEKSGGGGEFGLASGSLRTSADGLGRFCESLVQTLQQKVGRKLRDPRSVGRPGAESLFRLLCSLRGERACELQALVTQAFSGPDNREPDVLAGLSLAATGEQPTQRAFARSTYRNLLSNQEFVEWTRRGGRLERQLWWWAGACGSLSVLATVGLIVLLVTGR
ncbi:MAG: hypothetical protein KF861_23585, partial [Planctomycetaceae bacterium]|nr:hypothetical protein [Planctomycetaceae bacterium]